MRFEYYSTSEKEVVLHLAEPYRLVGDHIGDAFILIEAEKIISQFREKAGVSFGSLSDTGIPVSCDQDWEENGGRMCAKLPPLENKNSKITGVKLTPNQVIFSGEFPDKVIGEIINLLKNFNLSANKETKKMRITLDQGLLRLQPQIGLGVIISRITNSSSQSEAGNEVWKELNGVCERIKQKISAEEMGEIPEITGGRKCFKSLGVSSQYLVSSEALLKRVISGNSLYRINTTVEVNNLCSIRCYRSLGSYDLSGIQGDVIFRQGVAEDNYTGTNKRTIYLKNIPLLADAKGPFGNPYSDTPRTHVEEHTVALLTVIYGLDGIEHLKDNVGGESTLLEKYCQARIIQSCILSKENPQLEFDLIALEEKSAASSEDIVTSGSHSEKSACSNTY